MKILRNQNCPCESGLKYKNCCGNLTDQGFFANSENEASQNISNKKNYSLHLAQIEKSLSEKNYIRAQYLYQRYIDNSEDSSNANRFFMRISEAFGLHQKPKEISINPAERVRKYLIIKSWGFGFWSDVSHALSQLLISEITYRTPIIHWGGNSLYSINQNENAFELYFQPITDKNIEDIAIKDASIWPPKWKATNIYENDINKWDGEYSRLSGLYLLSRDESIAVADFYTPLYSILPFIPQSHLMHNASVDEVFSYLINKYLNPQPNINNLVDDFINKNINGEKFVAAHIRGSDKLFETPNLREINLQSMKIIDEFLEKNSGLHLFLMTDDAKVLGAYKNKYGERVHYTDALRTENSTGIHYTEGVNRYRLGVEIMMDTYIASNAEIFIGNGASNPSIVVSCLKKWEANSLYLLDKNLLLDPVSFLAANYP